jgi:hypothetical protein
MLCTVTATDFAVIAAANLDGGRIVTSSQDYPTLPSGVKLGLNLDFFAFQMPVSKFELLRPTNEGFSAAVRILTRSQFAGEFVKTAARSDPGSRAGIVYIAAQNQPILGYPARVLVRDWNLADRVRPSATTAAGPVAQRALAEADLNNPPPMLALIDGKTNYISGWPILEARPAIVWSNHLISFDCTVSYHEVLSLLPTDNGIPRVEARQEHFKANLWSGQTMALTLQATNPIIFEKAHTVLNSRFMVYISPVIVNARTGNYLNEKGEEDAHPEREDVPPQPLKEN